MRSQARTNRNAFDSTMPGPSRSWCGAARTQAELILDLSGHRLAPTVVVAHIQWVRPSWRTSFTTKWLCSEQCHTGLTGGVTTSEDGLLLGLLAGLTQRDSAVRLDLRDRSRPRQPGTLGRQLHQVRAIVVGRSGAGCQCVPCRRS